VKPGKEDLADKDLLAFSEMEDDVGLGGVVGLYFLGDVDLRVFVAALEEISEQRVAVAGEVAGREQLAGRSV
jgi:hypothetical protein